MTVEVAQTQGKGNIMAYGILRDSGCRYPRRTADSQVQLFCPALMAASATAFRPTTPHQSPLQPEPPE